MGRRCKIVNKTLGRRKTQAKKHSNNPGSDSNQPEDENSGASAKPNTETLSGEETLGRSVQRPPSATVQSDGSDVAHTAAGTDRLLVGELSNAQHDHVQTRQASLVGPETNSTSEIYHEPDRSPETPQAQDRQPSPILVIGSLWQVAAADLAADLDTKEQQKFDRLIKSGSEEQSPESSLIGDEQSPRGVNLVLSRAEKLRDSSKEKHAAWRPVLQKVIKGALAIKSLGDAAAKFDKSGYAGVVWSVVSFGLQVAENAVEAGKFVLSTIEVVTGLMVRYAKYETLFRGSDAGSEFDRRVTSVYKAIFIYVMALDDHLRGSMKGRITDGVQKPESSPVSRAKKAIDDADAEVKDWLLIILLQRQHRYFQRLREGVEGQPQSTSSSLANECLQSLAFSNMELRFHDIDDATEGTCKWLIRHDTYQRWAACDRGLLWIKGKPGSGKSTLLRYALGDTILTSTMGDEALILSFFFHGRGSELQKTPLGLFRSLLHQVLRAVPDALAELVATFQERLKSRGEPGEEWQWQEKELKRIFQSSLPKVLDTRPVWVFVDALDESGEGHAVQLVQDFKTMLEKLPSAALQLHICFSCRHYPIVYPVSDFEICLEDQNAADISTFVQARLSTSSRLSAPTSPISGLITKRAMGVFMWARFAVEKALALDNRGDSLKKIESSIQLVPPELHELYEGLVQDMDNVNKADALKLMQWICFATRPLTLAELRWAMALDADLKCPYKSLQQFQDAEDYTADNERMERRLKTLSCGLASVVRSSKQTSVVQFIHQSVKDFFVTKGLAALYAMTSPETKDTSTSEMKGLAHYRLSRICIRYFAMEEFAPLTVLKGGETFSRLVRGRGLTWEELSTWMSTFPLLHYATTSWIVHTQKSEALGVCQEDILDYFSWPSEGLTRAWTELAMGRWEWLFVHATMLHICSRYGLIGPLIRILQRIDAADVDVRDGNERTPLSWAAQMGHEHVVRHLLDHGAYIEHSRRWGHDGDTPLFLAIEYGHEAVVRLLIGRGARLDVPGKEPLRVAAWKGYLTTVNLLLDHVTDPYQASLALCDAADSGHADIVALLLGRGAEMEGSESQGNTPLMRAAERGHVTVIQLLLEKGALIEAKNKSGQTSLILAAHEGHVAVVRLLLERGANIEAKDNEGRTALLWASLEGRETAIERLLDKGADIEARDNEGKTALLWACGEQEKTAVKTLLKRVVNIQAQDNDGMTGLMWASLRGDETIVEMLLDKDANIEAKDNEGNTALLWASGVEPWCSGYETVVQTLLDRGANLETKDNEGKTALLMASVGGHKAVVKTLLNNDASIEAQDNDGKTALNLAAENKHKKVCKFLESRGAIFRPTTTATHWRQFWYLDSPSSSSSSSSFS